MIVFNDQEDPGAWEGVEAKVWDERLIDCSFAYTFMCAGKDPNPTVRPTGCSYM